MPVSFNTIPSGNGLMVPLFYAEVDNSAAFTPGNSNVALLFGQMLDSGTATAGKPVSVSSAVMVPLFYAEVDNSAAFTPGNSNVALLFGQMLDSGTATAGKPVSVSSAAMAKTLFGRGSMLARMVEAYRNTDVLGALYCIPLKDASTATKASATVTITGTASESGTVYLYIGADLVRVGVAAKDAANTVATSMVQQKHPPP